MASSDVEPMDKLKNVSQELMKALGQRAMGTVQDRVGGLTEKLDNIADGGPVGKAVAEGGAAAAEGKSPVGGALKGAVTGVKDKLTGGGGGNKSPKATKAMNIVEQIDVGVPITLAYNQWTQYDQFPSFMKKVENVDEMDDEDTKISWKAQVFWSHRSWEATVIEQYPDERIVWRSTGDKGHVDGAVTFHEITPNLTRILVNLEYYPQGFVERTGNIWRAAGRRARLELKHFRRHVMTRTILNPDEVEGWRGIIEDGEIVKTHDEVVEEEQQDQEDEYEDDEENEGTEQDAGSDEDAEDEYDEDSEADDGEEPEEAEEEDSEEEELSRRRRRRRAS